MDNWITKMYQKHNFFSMPLVGLTFLHLPVTVKYDFTIPCKNIIGPSFFFDFHKSIPA